MNPRAAMLSLAAIAGLATPTHGQVAQRVVDPGLVRIDSLIAADRLDEARFDLATWIDTHPAAPGADRAAAGLLRGRLARTWAEAEDAYLTTALAYPVTGQAPVAMLRLGQGLTAAAATGADPEAGRRAVAYLERLVTDYPTTPVRAQGYLWLARALHAQGRTPAACQRLDQAPAAADSITISLIESEKRTICNRQLVLPASRP